MYVLRSCMAAVTTLTFAIVATAPVAAQFIQPSPAFETPKPPKTPARRETPPTPESKPVTAAAPPPQVPETPRVVREAQQNRWRRRQPLQT